MFESFFIFTTILFIILFLLLIKYKFRYKHLINFKALKFNNVKNLMGFIRKTQKDHGTKAAITYIYYQ